MDRAKGSKKTNCPDFISIKLVNKMRQNLKIMNSKRQNQWPKINEIRCE